MKKKTLLIVLLILLILVLIGGGVFAYIYFGTDTFKTEKELFAKYSMQALSQDEFIPTLLEQFESRKEVQAYENNGSISVKTEIANIANSASATEVQSALNIANNTNITFQGKVDHQNRKVEENFQVNYSDSIKLPFSVRQDGDKYGLRVNEITNETYVAIENNNLPGLFQALGATDVSNIPNKIEIQEIESLKFSDEEKAHINETYITPIYTNISDEKFTKIENEDGSITHKLSLTPQEVINMMSQSLETLSTDQTMIDKLNSICNEFQTEFFLFQIYNTSSGTGIQTNPVTVEMIQELKNELDAETIEGGTINLLVTENKRNATKFVLEFTYEDLSSSSTTSSMQGYTTAESTDTPLSSAFGNNVSTGVTTEGQTGSSNQINLVIELSKNQTDSANVSYIFNISYNGVNYFNVTMDYKELNTNAPSESYSIRMGIPEQATTTYTLTNNLTFGNEIAIDGLNDTNSMLLNNRSSAEVLPFLQDYITRFTQMNANQMAQIGYPVDAINPIFTFWTGGVGIVMYMQKSALINSSVDLSTEEVEAFNSQFTSFEGTSVSGASVKTLLNTIKSENLTATNDSEKIQVQTTKGSELVNSEAINQEYTTTNYLNTIIGQVQAARTYEVSFAHDSTTNRITTAYIIEK